MLFPRFPPRVRGEREIFQGRASLLADADSHGGIYRRRNSRRASAARGGRDALRRVEPLIQILRRFARRALDEETVHPLQDFGDGELDAFQGFSLSLVARASRLRRRRATFILRKRDARATETLK